MHIMGGLKTMSIENSIQRIIWLTMNDVRAEMFFTKELKRALEEEDTELFNRLCEKYNEYMGE